MNKWVNVTGTHCHSHHLSVDVLSLQTATSMLCPTRTGLQLECNHSGNRQELITIGSVSHVPGESPQTLNIFCHVYLVNITKFFLGLSINIPFHSNNRNPAHTGSSAKEHLAWFTATEDRPCATYHWLPTHLKGYWKYLVTYTYHVGLPIIAGPSLHL